jgi:PAS domain S-box-containing protein
MPHHPLRAPADRRTDPSLLASLGGDAGFRVLVEQIRDFAIFLITPDGRHASWNAGVQRVLGYAHADFVGKPVHEIFTPEDVAAGIPQRELDLARREGRASDDRWMLKKGGLRFWASGVTTSLWHDDGRLLGFTKVLRDLTDQKALLDRVEASEIALRESQERLRLALSAARTGTWRWDVRAWVNPLDGNLARMLELGDRDVVVGLNDFFARIHPDDRERTRAAFFQAVERREPFRNEFRIVGTDGSTRWLRDHGEVIVGPEGDPIYLTGAAVDITEQRESDERLREIQRMEAVGKLAGGVAHEVNNMMGVVLGFSDFLLDDFPPGDRRRRDLEQIREAAGRAATVTAQLLAFSRRQILQPTLVKVSGIVEALRPVLARMLGEDKELVIRPAADVGYARADRGQLEQVIINLALNARDAMGQGGRQVAGPPGGRLISSAGGPVDRPAVRAVAGRELRPVHDHPGSLQGDEAAADHLIEFGKDRRDLVLGIDTLHDDREIERQHFDPVGAQPGARAESHDRTEDGCAGVVAVPQQLDDRLVERLAVILVALADVNAHQGALSLEAVHVASEGLGHTVRRQRSSSRARAKPASAAAMEPTTLSVM